MRRRNFIQAVLGGIAGALLWPTRRIRAWRARILVNGQPLPGGSMVQVAENHWHGRIDAGRVRPGDDLSIEFRPPSESRDVSVSLEF